MEHFFAERLVLPASIDAKLRKFAERLAIDGEKWTPVKRKAVRDYIRAVMVPDEDPFFADCWANELLMRINDHVEALRAAGAYAVPATDQGPPERSRQ